MIGLKAQAQWSFGPRIGEGFSKIIYNNNECYANFIMGLSGEYKIKNFGTELDVLFTEQGTFSRTYECILIPLKFKFYPQTTNGFNIFAGPQLTMYKEEPREFLHGGGDTTFHYRKTTASITAGIGYRFKSGIDVAINYNHGLVPLNKQDFNGKKGYERVFQITAGYDLSKLFKAGKNKYGDNY
jgi:hypothetical protein